MPANQSLSATAFVHRAPDKEKQIILPSVWEQIHPELLLPHPGLLLPQHIACPGCSVPRGQHPIPPAGAQSFPYLSRTTDKRQTILVLATKNVNAMRKRIKTRPDGK